MVKSKEKCDLIDTTIKHRNKNWNHEQYYVGERDDCNRRHGRGINNWSGAKSLESYDGTFTCNTMHGCGEYRWRHFGEYGSPFTYEGYFYNNALHGYGSISYPDGTTFRGLFKNNVRWGPGIQSHSAMRDDVGLWSGKRLVRLAWRPAAPSIVPDLMSNNIGKQIAEDHRKLFINEKKCIGEINSALDLLKICGADPRSAVENWKKLHPKNCTDVASAVCDLDFFDREYYKENIEYLMEINNIQQYKDTQVRRESSEKFNKEIYFAWNNSDITIDMMKHCYRHEKQRDPYEMDISSIFSGPRKLYKTPGTHESDCRTLLLTSYLGYTGNVAQLINKQNVHPNISDIQGNSALMYATCGDQIDTIRFLIEAGADVDLYNDSCCTPLGVALMRYACAVHEIMPNYMLQALLPPTEAAHPPAESRPLEWNISRELTTHGATATLMKTSSKTVRSLSQKKVKSLLSVKDQLTGKRKTDSAPTKVLETIYDSDDSLSENRKTYSDANREFINKVNDIYQQTNPSAVSYLFDFNNMILEIDNLEEEPKKAQEKNVKKVISKVIKDDRKTSKEIIWNETDQRKDSSQNFIDKQRMDMLEKIKLPIIELLCKGAKPHLVRCPQPALVMAIASDNPDLIRNLVQHGADVNEVYPQIYGYSPLDIAVSRPLTIENLEIIKALLECGANAQRCIDNDRNYSSDIIIFRPQKTGPTLLHATVAKKIENEHEEEIRRQLISLLLDYNCNPLSQYKGRSAIDLVMSSNINLFDVFIRNPKTDLNSIINDQNQSILTKMLTIPYFKSIGSNEKIQMLTNLLLYGADPLLASQNGQERFDNIFVFAKNTLAELETTQVKTSNQTEQKSKKGEKPKKDDKLSTRSLGKMVTDDKEDYRQAIGLVTECARILYIRWLQGKLIKDLIYTINKYKHRQWNVIVKECKNKKRMGLWITPHRSIEVWSILSTTRNKIYKDQRILKHLLSIVTFCAWRLYHPKKGEFKPGSKVTATIKDLIDKDVFHLLKEYKTTNYQLSEDMILKHSYVKPELDVNNFKYNVCFECALPLPEENILCHICKLVSFCNYECMKINTQRINCHPCSDDLKFKYFQTPRNSFISSVNSETQGKMMK